jgi:hypothetical protein
VGAEGQALEDRVSIAVAGVNPAEVRAFGPSSHDRSGTTALSATLSGQPSGATVRWTPAVAGAVTFVDPTKPTTVVQAGTPGLADVRIEVVTAAGVVARRATLRLSVPQFVVITENAAEFDLALTDLELLDVKPALMRRVDEVARHVLRSASVTCVVTSSPTSSTTPAYSWPIGRGSSTASTPR